MTKQKYQGPHNKAGLMNGPRLWEGTAFSQETSVQHRRFSDAFSTSKKVCRITQKVVEGTN